jgi:hypothetical protein
MDGGTGRPLAPSAAAQRARRYRHRQRRHLRVLPVEVDPFAVKDALITSGLLSEAEATDDSAVARAFALAFKQWKKFVTRYGNLSG